MAQAVTFLKGVIAHRHLAFAGKCDIKDDSWIFESVPNPMNPLFQSLSHICRIMKRLAERFLSIMADDDRYPPQHFSKSSTNKRSMGRKSKEKPTRRHQAHFYDPNRPNDTESSLEEVGVAELERHHTESLNRVEEAEAALAKERKRMEQLELRRKEVEAKEERQRVQVDEAAGLTSRQKNRRLYEKAVARVEGTALRRIEELERRFAHSDKIFELREGRRNMSVDEQRGDEAAEKEMKDQ